VKNFIPRLHLVLALTVYSLIGHSQSNDILPPVIKWKGKSEELIVKKDNPWITPTELTGFESTPSYTETMAWLKKLTDTGKLFRMISIGKSAQGRDINVIIASADGSFDKTSLKQSRKPLVLMQGGIHAGEIDGKEAGMMLLRDIAFGKKSNLLDGANILFIPILNVDGHERSGPYNRVNQRGPSNMGWRTNSKNLNLNRDYTKLDTEEIKAVISVMTDYDPDLYLDLHVTDGADYQYDITYGFSAAYSPAIGAWLKNTFTRRADKHLKDFGHIPGPLIFAANDKDFTEGMTDYPYTARFSNTYGDLRHVPSILVENHSLKPFRQRVLGTYVFLEAVLNILKTDGTSLLEAIKQDRNARVNNVVLTWKRTGKVDTIDFLGIESRRVKSEITGKEYVEWLGNPVKQKIPYVRFSTPEKTVSRPKAYWVPSTATDVIARLRIHGVQMEVIDKAREVNVKMARATQHSFAHQSFEGHVGVSATFTEEARKETFYPGSVRVPTDQYLGDLVIYLLEPESPDSFLQWGFFPDIFTRTEYIEEYAIEPLARKMLSSNEKLKIEFDNKKKSDPAFASNPQAIYEWFYSKSPYMDERWLLYPVGKEE
jgi:murein tripeptide amidase MpaA